MNLSAITLLMTITNGVASHPALRDRSCECYPETNAIYLTPPSSCTVEPYAMNERHRTVYLVNRDGEPITGKVRVECTQPLVMQ